VRSWAHKSATVLLLAIASHAPLITPDPVAMAAPSPPEWDLILSYAQKNWPDKIVDLLTNRGVDPDHSNAVGQTALHIASLWGHGTLSRALWRGS
jgi:ankyrin repeat protein